METEDKEKHPRERICCQQCGTEIKAEPYREFVVNPDNCCATEVVAVCSEECRGKHRSSG